MSLQLLVGTVKAMGIYHLKIQKILQAHCEAGRILEAAQVVAQVLYDDALLHKTIPEPKGVRTPELVARMWDAAKQLSETYAKRGVVCAKGFLPASQLMRLIGSRWENDFNSVLVGAADDHKLADELAPDFVTRSTVAAAMLGELLNKLPRTQDGDIVLPMKEMEGFCVTAVRRMHAAFVKPDVAVHELLHGETPKEDP